MLDDKNWADCNNCDYFFLIESKQACDKFDLIWLPGMFVVGTSKKCCFEYSSKAKEYNIPNLANFEQAVLYFYNPNRPNQLIEDIDL